MYKMLVKFTLPLDRGWFVTFDWSLRKMWINFARWTLSAWAFWADFCVAGSMINAPVISDKINRPPWKQTLLHDNNLIVPVFTSSGEVGEMKTCWFQLVWNQHGHVYLNWCEIDNGHVPESPLVHYIRLGNVASFGTFMFIFQKKSWMILNT